MEAKKVEMEQVRWLVITSHIICMKYNLDLTPIIILECFWCVIEVSTANLLFENLCYWSLFTTRSFMFFLHETLA